MIEMIHLANQGAYDAVGAKLHDLKPLNFIFGSNGSGKTTISRVIENVNIYDGCTLVWSAGKPLETRVYNRDFVEKHFDLESVIKGVYTFGENVPVVERIKELKLEVNIVNNKLNGLQALLSGEDGKSGKQKDRDDLGVQLVGDIWNAKRKFDDLDDAFKGLNSNKAKFCDRYLGEVTENKALLRDVSDLRIDAATVFSSTISEITLLPDISINEITKFEDAEILAKKVIGKQDIDIAALIRKLGNSDWIQQGRYYFEQLNDECPFCQQKTSASFRQSLEEYFDENYVTALVDIENLLNEYEYQSNALMERLTTTAILDSKFIDRKTYEKDIAALRLSLETNVTVLKGKKNEPSVPVALSDVKQLFDVAYNHIVEANSKIKSNNDTFYNIGARKHTLSSEIWKRLLEDTKVIYEKFEAQVNAFDKTISNLTVQIEKRNKELEEKQAELEENERKITSIKPTIDAINKLLKSFGFKNFYLCESGNKGFYEVKRHDGTDAKCTLSEGEKSFITFLYFFHLIKGSFSDSGAMTDRIVVFDDPVSSLDADILFIVCSLIKGVVNEMRTGKSSIKQIFVLTHNIYFHKEITFNKKRSGANAMHDENFWVIRKSSSSSEIVHSPQNPIKSSYELLWREVKQKPPSDTALQNVMRRILEHYFKFFGGTSPENIIEAFEGEEKLICGSLLSWVNDGSHFANDDLFMSCDPGQTERYLTVFQRVFEESGHDGHYKMMMGDDYIALPSSEPEHQPAEAMSAVADA